MSLRLDIVKIRVNLEHLEAPKRANISIRAAGGRGGLLGAGGAGRVNLM